jgi:hypothetical protein
MARAVKGVIELRKAMKEFEPDLAKSTQKEIANFVKPVTAKGYAPSEAPLSGWSKAVGLWANRVYDLGEIKRGITYSTTPTKPNNKGFRSVATIYNKSAAGAIYETAGRKSGFNGRPVAPSVQHYANAGTRNARADYMVRSSDKNYSQSANPNAGKQFIESLGKMHVATRAKGQGGRLSRKMNGRLIFRAFSEDQGKATAGVMKAIEAAETKFKGRTR